MSIAKIVSKGVFPLGLVLASLTQVGTAQAQTILDPSTWFSSGPEADKQRQDDLKQAGTSREYKPAQIGLWLVESNVNAGAIVDSNLYSSHINAKSATGVLFAPSIIGRYTDGAQTATAYLDGNVKRYAGDVDLTTFGGRLGIGNSVELQRGLVWKALLQVARTQDENGAFNATGQGDDASGVYVKPINTNSLFAATSVLSRLDYAQFSGFVSGGLSANLTRYEDAELSDNTKLSQSSRDTNAYTATGRVGWSLSPVIYTFLEPSVSLQQSPNVTNGDTTTYRLTTGLGTDRINLVRGEVFAGYARQMFNDLKSDAENGGVYGGRISWFPTRDVTFNLTVDDSLGVTASDDGTGQTKVFPSRTKSASADLSYLFDRRVTLALRSSLSKVSYSDTGRKDDVVRLGADATYMVSGNLGLKLGYSRISVNSNSDLNDVDRNIYTIGLNGRF